ncbi:amidase family protein [Psychroflexus sp. ALD_RP9]|uniref:amidase family protein n=1 Tax=Psychroflexus sp. ALD_RP9 TaxID=2777186 RepID=UPI001A8E8A6D|nr:amidase family protein [Psychroflexus sp. ALD_RP9]QSS96942.1 amidase [Psychroflexus sp. ALD_RP9]
MRIYKPIFIFIVLLGLNSCNNPSSKVSFPEFDTWKPYDESAIIDSSQQNDNPLLRYQLIQSSILDKNELLKIIEPQLKGFTKDIYHEIFPLIYENSITEIQKHISHNKLSYKLLTQWYLFRIALHETNRYKNLNAIISINPNAVAQAEMLDERKNENIHPIYGMPILLKDNINTSKMPTTAGAIALINNRPHQDAEIVTNLKNRKAIILGKVNLSEWANFLCNGCPNGYSAVGGQTMNPYGPRRFDTGGSSSGSAASVAANYAVAAVGTETSGSILSPSSQQSLVGLKPTIGQLSQNGIIPISSTLDTPGPITRTVSDNGILLSAMRSQTKTEDYLLKTIEEPSKLRLGAIKAYMKDSLYLQSIDIFKNNSLKIEVIEPKPMNFSGFLALLNGDMKRDLKAYLKQFASDSVKVKSVSDVVNFNTKDSTLHMPYGQARLNGIVRQDLNDIELDSIRKNLIQSGKTYFDRLFDNYQLDAILSINNYNAGQAAVAKYPAITIPMGYSKSGKPKGLTIIMKSGQEQKLLSLAKFYEQLTNYRKPPQEDTKNIQP